MATGINLLLTMDDFILLLSQNAIFDNIQLTVATELIHAAKDTNKKWIILPTGFI